jgi:transcriptional regulator with XRE-family HTH domain
MMLEMKVSDQIRRAIDQSGITRYRLWKITGVSQATLSRFATGKAALSMEALDLIGEVLGMRIVVTKDASKARKGKGR